MANTCGVCFEEYADVDERKPIFLPCGHTFCRQCVRASESSDRLCCECRESWGEGKADSLPVCYQLIPGTVQERKCSPKKCWNEETEKVFTCNKCNDSICKTCFVQFHSKCDVKIRKECFFLKRMKIIKQTFDGESTK